MREFSYFYEALRNRGGLTNKPRFLTYCVTFRCQARCKMCASWKKPPGDELTLLEIERIFRQLPRLDGVRLTGGEPFLRTDLFEITALVQNIIKPNFFHISSNGFLTERIIEFCEHRNRDIKLHLMISIDGWVRKHNEIRGVPLAWEKSISTIKSLAPRQKELNICLTVNQTIIDQKGIEDYKKIFYLCNKIGVRHNSVLAYEGQAIYNSEPEVIWTRSDGNNLINPKKFDQHQLITWFKDVQLDINKLPILIRLGKKYYQDGIYNRWFKNRKVPRPNCVALNSHLRLLPDGGIPVCQFNSKIIGSLKEASFNDIWNSSLAQKARAWVKGCSGCWAECEVIPSAIYSGDLLLFFVTQPGKLLRTLFNF